MQIDSDGEEEMQMRTEGEKDRAKDNNQVKIVFLNLFIYIFKNDIVSLLPMK